MNIIPLLEVYHNTYSKYSNEFLLESYIYSPFITFNPIFNHLQFLVKIEIKLKGEDVQNIGDMLQ